MELCGKLFLLTLISPLILTTNAIKCYSKSQLQVVECSSINCIKQTLGLDTVRYCDGTGGLSICQTYHISDSCESIPHLGNICCCSNHLCNAANGLSLHIAIISFVLELFL
ncbi:unnamed protein product [Dracunculus medinensis]|uniref:Activin_recp domain-containing protein n=1 Tax=Dracunculus medinensis TaxID=318479 RepID=A0A0N4UH87_DRAME|nr:unnamed protein product [Dracunculus medinensis]